MANGAPARGDGRGRVSLPLPVITARAPRQLRWRGARPEGTTWLRRRPSPWIARPSLWFRRLEVVGSSMLPTLQPGDRLVVVRTLKPKVGDLVALRDPAQPSRLLVKRLVSRDRGRLTVAGDNPEASRDSRDFGPVERASLVGRALYCYHPPERSGPIRRRGAGPRAALGAGRPGRGTGRG